MLIGSWRHQRLLMAPTVVHEETVEKGHAVCCQVLLRKVRTGRHGCSLWGLPQGRRSLPQILQNQCFPLPAMSAAGRYLRTKGLISACLGLQDEEYGYRRVKLSLQSDKKKVLQLTDAYTAMHEHHQQLVCLTAMTRTTWKSKFSSLLPKGACLPLCRELKITT